MDIMGPPTKLKSYEGKYHTNALDKKVCKTGVDRIMKILVCIYIYIYIDKLANTAG